MPEPKKTADEIEAAFAAEFEKARSNQLCNLGKVIRTHEHGALIEAKVKDEVNYAATMISRVLKGLGIAAVSDDVISKHRRGLCRCPKDEDA